MYTSIVSLAHIKLGAYLVVVIDGDDLRLDLLLLDIIYIPIYIVDLLRRFRF